MCAFLGNYIGTFWSIWKVGLFDRAFLVLGLFDPFTVHDAVVGDSFSVKNCINHFHTMPHFDALKLYSTAKTL